MDVMPTDASTHSLKYFLSELFLNHEDHSFSSLLSDLNQSYVSP